MHEQIHVWEIKVGNKMQEIFAAIRNAGLTGQYGINVELSSYHSWKTLPKLSDLIIYSFLDTCVQHWTLIFKDQIVLSGMISCDMLAVLCYLWIYSKLVGALSLSKRIFICRCCYVNPVK